MAKCMYCGVNEVSGKAKTCSNKCRKGLSRLSVTSTVTSVKCDTPSVTSEQELFEDWQQEISELPQGVVKPSWKPDVAPTSWQTSRGYFDAIVKLLVLTVSELEARGQWIPSWKYKREGLI